MPLSRILDVANLCFNAIRKNKILAKIYSTQLSLLGEQPDQGLFSVCFSKPIN